MRAMAISEFGGPEKLRRFDLPRPRPAKGEVLVRVVAAGVNPVDGKIREGQLAATFPHAFPLIPGWDAAGVIEEFGEGATRFRKGDRVWTYARKAVVQWGCYAEYVAVPESSVALMPSKLLYEEAAGVPLAALTAYQCLFARGGIGKGSRLLVHAAAGGVGHFAVQLAADAGAFVLGTAGPRNQEFVLGLGARVVVDYEKDDFVEVVRREAPDGLDFALCCLDEPILERTLPLMKAGGRLVSITVPPDGGIAAASKVFAYHHFVEPDAEQLGLLARLVDRGRLKPHVQKIYPLAEAIDAQTTVAGGHVRGKLVLNI